MYIVRQSVIKDYQIVKLMFEVNAFIVTYLITEIMTKFTTQRVCLLKNAYYFDCY